jgi:hypothetical protein
MNALTIDTQQLQAFAQQLEHERMRNLCMEEAQSLYWLGHSHHKVKTLVRLARMHNHQAIRARKQGGLSQ